MLAPTRRFPQRAALTLATIWKERSQRPISANIQPADTVDSFVCVSVTNAATFTNIPNGTYIDAVTGDVKNVTNGTLSIAASGKGNMRVYVLSSGGFDGISGKIGTDGTYLK